MFRPAGRSLLRHSSTRPAILLRPAAASTRTLFTTTPKKKSGFKGTAVRWALAGGIVYWYATSNVFAGQPKFLEEEPAGPSPEDPDRPPSLLPEESRRGKKLDAKPRTLNEDARAKPAAPEELEEEAGQEGAFNPETGEINWDCPCLGGMAHGPCGEEFKTAFSCFVFSTEEPKGADCIEKFKGMQSCFQKHPEVYGSELEEEEEEEEAEDDGESSITDEGAPGSTADPKPADTPRGDQPAASADGNAKTKTQTLSPQAASETQVKSGGQGGLWTPNEVKSENEPRKTDTAWGMSK